MALSSNRQQAFSRAEELLTTGDDALLRYVCLEIRLCLEFITYDKLLTYSERLPKAFRRWQPAQFMKALRQIEPNADKSFTLTYSPESEPGRPTGERKLLGQHIALNLAWLRRTYNKLGHYLHAPFPEEHGYIEQLDTSTLRSDLEQILRELEPVMSSNLDSSLAMVTEFSCAVCDQPVVCNAEGLRQVQKAICLDPNCNAEHIAAEDASGALKFTLVATPFLCRNCEEPNLIHNRLLEVGYEF
jgi:hypothetical protein